MSDRHSDLPLFIYAARHPDDFILSSNDFENERRGDAVESAPYPSLSPYEMEGPKDEGDYYQRN